MGVEFNQVTTVMPNELEHVTYNSYGGLSCFGGNTRYPPLRRVERGTSRAAMFGLTDVTIDLRSSMNDTVLTLNRAHLWAGWLKH